MRVNIRSVGLVLAALLGAMVLAFGSATTALAANKAVMIGGIDAGKLPDLVMQNIQGGAYKNYDRINAVWPGQAKPYTGANDLTLGASIAVGIPSLKSSIDQALASLKGDETVTIVGMSAGCLVVDELLRQYAADGTGPDPSKVKIILMADSSRQATIKGKKYNKIYDYTYQPPVDAPYNITVVTKEYDGTSDFPDRVFNFTAVMNAYAGSLLLHDTTFFTDLSTVPASNITVSQPNSLGGLTTHYLIPTDKLPLVQLMPFLAPREAQLKATVDRGYSRNDATTATASTAALATPADTKVRFGKVRASAATMPIDESTAARPEDTNTLTDVVPSRPAKTGHDAATSVNGATDLKDGNMATAPTTSQATAPSKKAWKPGDGTLKHVIQKLLAGKPPKVDQKTGASTKADSASSSSTSSESSSAA